MTTYNWQQKDWPHFRYDLSALQETFSVIAEKMGRISGKVSALSEPLQKEALIDALVEEATKTSKIEGEILSRPELRSSLKNKLGLNPVLVPVHDKRAKGMAELLLDARQCFRQPLTEEKLFEWHLLLFGGSTHVNLRVGHWRSGEEPMQVVSESRGKVQVHFEAPPSLALPQEMETFIQWFNDTAPGKKDALPFPALRSALAHLYFESIHPFEDGNGRIGRVLAEKALSQGFGYPVILSLSQAIEADKKQYYAALKEASTSNEVTAWLDYFTKMVLEAERYVEKQINFILQKAVFFDRLGSLLNERQLKVVKRMLATGLKGFEGGMSAKKYGVITGASKATATRDLQQLLALRAFRQIGSGRSVRYELNLEL